mgnify:CR=1 FL=1
MRRGLRSRPIQVHLFNETDPSGRAVLPAAPPPQVHPRVNQARQWQQQLLRRGGGRRAHNSARGG